MKEIIDILNCMVSNCGHKEHSFIPYLLIVAVISSIVYIKTKCARNKSK